MPTVARAGWSLPCERLGNGPPLLLIHGTGGDGASSWQTLAPALAKSRTLLLPSYAGSGFGHDAGGPLRLDLLVGQMTAVLDDLAGPGPVDVLGFSLGAVVAAALAARQPQRVRRLVLLAGWASSDDARLQLSMRLWQQLQQGDARTFAAYSTLLAFSPAFLSALGHAKVDELLGWQPPADIARQIALDREIDIAVELAAIRAPTLVIAGREDQLVPIDHVRRLQAGIAGSTLQVLDAGHMLAYERPAELLAALAGFLASDAV